MDLFNIKRVRNLETRNQTLEKELMETNNLFRGRELLASRGRSIRDHSFNKIVPLSDTNNAVADHRNFSTYRDWYQNTIAKRVIDIMPDYALQNKPLFFDVDVNGELVKETKFTQDLDTLFSYSKGSASNSSITTIRNYKAVNLNSVMKEADKLAYGRWGAIYLMFDDEDPSLPVNTTIRNNLLGAFPLDEGDSMFTEVEGQIMGYNLKLDDGIYINNVHPSRVVHITDNNVLRHTPRLKDVFIEITNIHDLALSLRKNLAISSPKIEVALPLLEGNSIDDLETLFSLLQEQASSVIKGDDDIIVGAGVLPKFNIPTVRSIQQQLNDSLTTLAVKMNVPLRILLGTEQYKSASEQDTVNFENTVQIYREEHLTNNVLKPLVDKLIYTNAVSQPLDVDKLNYVVVWPSNNTENIKKINGEIVTLAEILKTNVLNDKAKENILKILEHQTESLLKLYEI
jgi:hypothetical protein